MDLGESLSDSIKNDRQFGLIFLFPLPKPPATAAVGIFCLRCLIVPSRERLPSCRRFWGVSPCCPFSPWLFPSHRTPCRIPPFRGVPRVLRYWRMGPFARASR